MKKLTRILLLICVLTLSACSGHGVKDIAVTSMRIVSVAPNGTSGLTALIELGLHNPTVGFEVTNLEAVVKARGDEALLLTADLLMVQARSDKMYNVPVKGQIKDGFNPFQLLKLFSNDLTTKELTIDVKAKAALRGGVGKNIEIKDLVLEDLLESK